MAALARRDLGDVGVAGHARQRRVAAGARRGRRGRVVARMPQRQTQRRERRGLRQERRRRRRDLDCRHRRGERRGRQRAAAARRRGRRGLGSALAAVGRRARRGRGSGGSGGSGGVVLAAASGAGEALEDAHGREAGLGLALDGCGCGHGCGGLGRRRRRAQRLGAGGAAEARALTHHGGGEGLCALHGRRGHGAAARRVLAAAAAQRRRRGHVGQRLARQVGAALEARQRTQADVALDGAQLGLVAVAAGAGAAAAAAAAGGADECGTAARTHPRAQHGAEHAQALAREVLGGRILGRRRRRRDKDAPGPRTGGRVGVEAHGPRIQRLAAGVQQRDDEGAAALRVARDGQQRPGVRLEAGGRDRCGGGAREEDGRRRRAAGGAQHGRRQRRRDGRHTRDAARRRHARDGARRGQAVEVRRHGLHAGRAAVRRRGGVCGEASGGGGREAGGAVRSAGRRGAAGLAWLWLRCAAPPRQVLSQARKDLRRMAGGASNVRRPRLARAPRTAAPACSL
ncbi:hypothetical protein FA09DRAFT_261275 [Tilletiopsis washingtonensis]|uniref:Uncharacterized protein n=1 Tax=Tilletiopsis washingtonensis TaxID=58919 RepID=A0A316ZDS0_9BASI|nr:hypothetical protein FA09DRAFT_261275 [Tilletiopsis washingtonensis]PWN98383.1 hypothetical protein FA09DRAFT_261275 [Tilletiopsis washingtonensis]